MVKTIILTQNKVSLVDDDDFDELNKYKWCANKDHRQNTWYAIRTITCNGKKTHMKMHRKIMGFPSGKMIDHINHDGLDNRRCNLRICTRSENLRNCKIHKNNTSGLHGVTWHKEMKKWMASIRKDNETFYLGYFHSKEDAGHAVDKKAKELYGTLTLLNFMEIE